MKRLTYLLAVSLMSLGISCGDDSGGGTGTPDARLDGGGGGPDAHPADGGGGGSDGGGGGIDANTGNAAQTFCDDYDTRCGYGDQTGGYDTEEQCLGYYNAAPEACKTCIRQHLDNVVTLGTSHCEHTWGTGPCDTPCPTFNP